MVYIPKRIPKIKVGAKALGLDDKDDRDDYEAFLFGITGKTSCSDMTLAELDKVLYEMTRRGAFKRAKKPLTGVQKACVAKWYKLRALEEVNSKDKSSLNRFVKKQFGKRNVADLTVVETNKLAGMLEEWIRKTERRAGQDERVIQTGR